MIKINYEISNNIIKKVKIKGHANYADYGNDIVCASISSIAICSINSALLIDNKSLKYIEKDGLLEIYDIKDENVTQKILLNMIELFKELKKQYPKNIQIKE